MGKAANNERKKLEATFWNNIGVGVTISGAFVPYLTLLLRFAEFNDWLRGLMVGKWYFNSVEATKTITALALAVGAFRMGVFFRERADDIAATIED